MYYFIYFICLNVPVPDDLIFFKLREVQTICQLSHTSFQSNCQNKSGFWSADVFFKQRASLLPFIWFICGWISLEETERILYSYWSLTTMVL